MDSQTQWRLWNLPIFLVGGGFLIGSILGLTGGVLAADPLMRLHVESGRLTGQLSQVPLRALLDRLHDRLGINYVVPAGELGKVVSVTLKGESLPVALSKILAFWDYAVIFDAVGNVKTIYVMAKDSPEAILNASGSTGKEQLLQKDAEPRMRYEEQEEMNPSLRLPMKESTGMSGKEVTNKFPMEIRSPAPGISMSILPANTKSMQIIPGTRKHHMNIIASTAYPPMNIQPVPEHVQQELLLTLRP